MFFELDTQQQHPKENDDQGKKKNTYQTTINATNKNNTQPLN
jgi:hypothetical protein